MNTPDNRINFCQNSLDCITRNVGSTPDTSCVTLITIRRTERDDSEITEAFRQLMPEVTRLVALHFQRTLVGRALDRLGQAGDEDRRHLERALADTARKLEVQWR